MTLKTYFTLIDARFIFDAESASTLPIACSSFSISLGGQAMTEANSTRLLRRRWVGTKGVPFPYISITHQLLFSYSYRALSTALLSLQLAHLNFPTTPKARATYTLPKLLPHLSNLFHYISPSSQYMQRTASRWVERATPVSAALVSFELIAL